MCHCKAYQAQQAFGTSLQLYCVASQLVWFSGLINTLDFGCINIRTAKTVTESFGSWIPAIPALHVDSHLTIDAIKSCAALFIWLDCSLLQYYDDQETRMLSVCISRWLLHRFLCLGGGSKLSSSWEKGRSNCKCTRAMMHTEMNEKGRSRADWRGKSKPNSNPHPCYNEKHIRKMSYVWHNEPYSLKSS